jgi:DNA-binding XRE family transcriptional regulator
MLRKWECTEPELAKLAKQFRLQSGESKADAAREFGVARSTIQLAEENPEQSLTKLRIRLIERYSKRRVAGPFYRLEKH